MAISHFTKKRLEKWRDWMEDHPGPVWGGVGLFVALVLFVLFRPRGDVIVDDTPRVTHVWYIDLNTKKPFAVSLKEGNDQPPLEAPSGKLKVDDGPMFAEGPAGARLRRFACGSCGKSEFDGLWETYVAPAKAALAGDPDKRWNPEAVELISQGHFYKAVGSSTWIAAESPEAMALWKNLENRCGSDRLVECYPNKEEGSK